MLAAFSRLVGSNGRLVYGSVGDTIEPRPAMGGGGVKAIRVSSRAVQCSAAVRGSAFWVAVQHPCFLGCFFVSFCLRTRLTSVALCSAARSGRRIPAALATCGGRARVSFFWGLVA